jgi:4-amino-4-deoxy-L-arabinose transferase-like glycosyltransferase
MPSAPPRLDAFARRLPPFWFALACATIVAIGLVSRLWGIGDRMLCHPENFAPGLDLPSWVRFPPPRHDIESILRGTLIDGHPPTYFVAMLGWVEAFGASLTSLRMPSALLGALSIALVAMLALREGGRLAALLAAALLALHGHHVYWSQLARMYVPASCLVLLSTWFLWRLRERGRAFDLWACFATTTLALWTQLYAWPLVFAQMIADLVLSARQRRAPVGLRIQLLAVIASLPVVQLSMYQDPPSRWHEPAVEYLEFGYLFHSRVPFLDVAPAITIGGESLLIVGLIVLAIGAWVPREPVVVQRASDVAGVPAKILWSIVAASTLLLVAFAAFAPLRPRIERLPLWIITAVPLVMALGAGPLERWLGRKTTSGQGALARIAALDLPPSVYLALVPFACMVAVSAARGAFVARGTIVFLPFLVLALAHGFVALLRVRWLGVASLTAVLALHVASTVYFRRAESSPRDYRGLAEQMKARLSPSDRILVKNDFSSPPLIYYLRDHDEQFIHRDYVEILRDSPSVSCVWVPQAEEHETPQAMLDGVADFVPTDVVRSHKMWATRYERR